MTFQFTGTAPEPEIKFDLIMRMTVTLINGRCASDLDMNGI